MKVAELRQLDKKALEDRLVEQRRLLFDLRFSHASAQLEKTADIPKAKKGIARIMTILKEKELAS